MGQSMNYRNKRLLELARQLPCQVCGRSDGTVAAAHSNRQMDGKGTGIKANDYRIAAMCAACHFEIDNGNNLSREERQDMWETAHRQTIGEFFERDMIGVL
jgi:hypothetical protein